MNSYSELNKKIERALIIVLVVVFLFIGWIIGFIKTNVDKVAQLHPEGFYQTIRHKSNGKDYVFIVKPSGVIQYIEPGTTYWRYNQMKTSIKKGGKK